MPMKQEWRCNNLIFHLPAKPSAPEGPIVFSDIKKTSLTVAWNPPAKNGGSPLTGYILEQRDAWKMSWTQVAKLKPDITSYSVQNLKEGQEYIYRVMAENLVGRSEALESDKVKPKSPFSEFCHIFVQDM